MRSPGEDELAADEEACANELAASLAQRRAALVERQKVGVGSRSSNELACRLINPLVRSQINEDSAAVAAQAARSKQRSALPDFYEGDGDSVGGADNANSRTELLPQRAPLPPSALVKPKSTVRPKFAPAAFDIPPERPQRARADAPAKSYNERALTDKLFGIKREALSATAATPDRRGDHNDSICAICEGDGELMVPTCTERVGGFSSQTSFSYLFFLFLMS